MDRDVVRVVLLLLGILWILGIYLWDRYKHRVKAKARRYFERRRREPQIDTVEDEELPLFPEDSNGDTQESWGQRRGRPRRKDADGNQRDLFESVPARVPAPPDPSLPPLIQFSVVAAQAGTFAGDDLLEAFAETGLEFGRMDIFHRYAEHTDEVLFSVASLVNPGTFPIADMAHFSTPGVVLFMQPDQMDPELVSEAFEDMVDTCRQLALRLRGEQWDERRQRLSADKIDLLRSRLQPA